MRIDAPNYTQVPNILLDEWLNILGHAELKVILFIVRKTIGYHKVRDKISILQIQENTGLTRSNVTSAVKSLINRKLIKKVTSGKNGASSSYYELVISELSNNSDQSCSNTGTSPKKGLVENNLGSSGELETIQIILTSPVAGPTKESVLKPIRKEKCKRKSEQVPPSADAVELTDFFISSIKRRDEAFQKKDPSKWTQELDRLMRIDGRKRDEIEDLILWTESDYKFWRSACMSPENLRKNFSKIKVKKDSDVVIDKIKINRDYAVAMKQKYPKSLKL